LTVCALTVPGVSSAPLIAALVASARTATTVDLTRRFRCSSILAAGPGPSAAMNKLRRGFN
jgi:hypothetical protein